MPSYSIEFRTLLGLILISVTFFVGFSADSQIFGYSLINIFYFFIAVSVIIIFVWYLLRNKSKISIRHIKQEFNVYIRALKSVRTLPDSIKNTVLISYIALILMFIGVIISIISKVLYGTLNGNWEDGLAVIFLLLGLMIFGYMLIIMLLKLKKSENKPLLQTQFNLIMMFFVICLYLNILFNEIFSF